MSSQALDVRPFSRLFKALGDETRLRIVALLAHGELCVCHLEETLQLSQPKVSRHLAILRRAGLVDVRREGRWMFYTVAAPPSPLHRTLLRCMRGCLGDVDELAADRARLHGLATRLRCT